MKTKIKLLSHVFIMSALLFGTKSMLGQAGAKWSMELNSIGNGDGLGTSNNFPLTFFTNSSPKMVLGTNGVLQVNSLSGSNTRFLQTDASGNLVSFPMGQTTDILYGNGTWGSLPIGATSWSVIGNHVFNTNIGNVGIGTNNPIYKLDVIGDVRVSNNLYVGGGIIITDQVNASDNVNTGSLFADTIRMNPGGVVDGATDFTGEIKGADKLTVNGNATFSSNVTVQNNLIIGSSTSDFQLSFTPPNGPNPSLLTYGKISTLNPPIASTCSPSYYVPPPIVNQFGSLVRLYNIGAGNSYVLGTTILDIGSNVNAAYINSAYSPLYINDDCRSNTYLMGSRVGFGTSAPTEKFHFTGGNIRLDNYLGIGTGNNSPSKPLVVNGEAVFIADAGPNSFEVLANNQVPSRRGISFGNDPNGAFNFFVHPWQTNACFNFKESLNNTTLFKINGNTGQVQVGTKTSTSHPNAEFMVFGTIVCKEMYVTKPADWPDYVFQSSYKLLSLNEVENYYKKESHLPNVPSEKELEGKDVNVAEMDAILLRKIEELTIYTVELNKEMKKLKEELAILKN